MTMAEQVKSVAEDMLYPVAVFIVKSNMRLGQLQLKLDMNRQARKCMKCSRKSCLMRIRR